MKIVIAPGKLAGAIPLPSSKSQTHRALLAASLGHGVSTLRGITLSQDIEATLSCLRALGAGVVDRGNTLEICGIGGRTRALRTGIPQLDCGESGSTLRFLIPIALALLGGGEFTGRGRLMKRPLNPYFQLFERRGIAYRLKDGILRVQGTLSPGRYELPGNVSSQFITGLLFALPLLAGDSELVLTSPLESRDYVKMTLDILEKYGIQLENRADTGFVIPGGQQFEARDWTVERDWSQGAFWYAANFLGGQVELPGLNSASVQGDKEIATDYRRLSQSGAECLSMPRLGSPPGRHGGCPGWNHPPQPRRPTAPKGERPAFLCHPGPQCHGSPGKGGPRLPDHSWRETASRGRNGGLLPGSPHCHDGRRICRLCPKTRDFAGGGMRP